MKKFLFLLLSVLLVFPSGAVSIDPTEEESSVALVTSVMLLKHHYVKRERNQENSMLFLQAYLKTLDPQHLYFTRSQVENWEEQGKDIFQKLDGGDVRFGFYIYYVYLRRLREYEKFVNSLDLESMDLNSDEVFEADRSKAPWPENEAGLKKLWLGKVKNELIALHLFDRIEAEESAKETGPGRNARWAKKSPAERIRKRVTSFVRNSTKMERLEVLGLYLNSFAAVFDPHTVYMPPQAEEEFNMSMSLSLSGIGAVLSSSEDGYTKIVEVMPGGPADRDGRLKAGDRIIAVAQGDGEDVDIADMSLNKVVAMIRGKTGTSVTLTVLDGHKGLSAAPSKICLVRDKVQIRESEAKGEIRTVSCSDGKTRRIGVIFLPSFYVDFQAYMDGEKNYKSCTRDVQRIIRELQKDGRLDALVMDLRANGGGSLAEAVSLTGLFIPEGPVVQVRDASGDVEIESDDDGGKVAWNGPLVVLTNKLSASASEIFAAAIQDHQRGIVVGDAKTHGKGSVQTVHEVKEFLRFLGSGKDTGLLKFSVSKFYRVNGASTQLRGVAADIVFPSFTDVMDIGEDHLDHPMPWDSIPAITGVVPFDKTLARSISILKKESEKRIASSPEFQALRRDIERYREVKKRTTVSLNLETRWREYLADKKMNDDQTKLLKLDADSSSTTEKKKNRSRDIYLDEVVRIAGDFSALQQKTRQKKD